MYNSKPERNEKILACRKAGNNYQQIANQFNISRQRIGQIITGYKNSPQQLKALYQRKKKINKEKEQIWEKLDRKIYGPKYKL